MIVTVTANPSIDLTMAVDARPNGDVQRARWVLVEPSGKGVNVAVALRREVLAVLPVGRGPGADLAPMLAALDLPFVGIPVAGHVRTNVSLVEEDGTTSKVNEGGAPLTAAAAASLTEASMAHSGPGDWVAWCGSLPAGFGVDVLADAVAAGRRAGRRVALDTSQAALDEVLGRPAGELPHLIKPNADELAELSGRGFATLGDIADAATSLVASGIATVLVSLGPDGAILADQAGARHAVARPQRVANTAGAGDSLLAGYLSAERSSADERLATAVRFGAVAVAQPGTLFTAPDTYPAARVQPVDRSAPLSAPVDEPLSKESAT